MAFDPVAFLKERNQARDQGVPEKSGFDPVKFLKERKLKEVSDILSPEEFEAQLKEGRGKSNVAERVLGELTSPARSVYQRVVEPIAGIVPAGVKEAGENLRTKSLLSAIAANYGTGIKSGVESGRQIGTEVLNLPSQIQDIAELKAVQQKAHPFREALASSGEMGKLLEAALPERDLTQPEINKLYEQYVRNKGFEKAQAMPEQQLINEDSILPGRVNPEMAAGGRELLKLASPLLTAEGRAAALQLAQGTKQTILNPRQAIISAAQEYTPGVAKAGEKVIEKVSDVTEPVKTWTQNKFEISKINKAEAIAKDVSVKDLANEAAERVSPRPPPLPGSSKIPSIATTEGQAASNAVEKAVSSGVEYRDAALFVRSTPAEIEVGDKILKSSKKYNSDFQAADDPYLIGGNEFRKRVDPLLEIQNKVGKELSAVASALPEGSISTAGVNTREAVISRMKKVKGLDGLSIDDDGQLNFSRTSMKGHRSESMRKELQKDFDEITNEGASGIHNKRQELYDEVSKVDYEKQGAREKALNAMRQGGADILEKVSPQYKQLNKEYATTSEIVDDLKRYLKLPEDAAKNTLDLEASLLVRRLTSNAQSNPKIRHLLSEMEGKLGEHGITFDTRMDTVQEMLNAATRYYPNIKRGTSLAGQVEAGTMHIPTSKSQIIQGGIEKLTKPFANTEVVRQQRLEDLIKTLSPKPKTSVPLQVTPGNLTGEQARIAETLKAQARKEALEKEAASINPLP